MLLFPLLVARCAASFEPSEVEYGPVDAAAGYDADEGYELRFCWANVPGKRMRVLPVNYNDTQFNVTAAALRHMFQLGSDDLQSCASSSILSAVAERQTPPRSLAPYCACTRPCPRAQ